MPGTAGHTVRRSFLLLGMLIAHGWCNVVAAQDKTALRTENAWCRATAPGQTMSAAYITIVNTGGSPDRLLAVSSPVAEAIEIHDTRLSGGVMRMRPVTDGLVVPARSRVELKPLGVHLMLIGIKTPLEAGREMSAKLRFENAGVVDVVFRIDSTSGTTRKETR